MYKIRGSTRCDLPSLLQLYSQARQIQLDSGNLHQWAEGYPSEDVIRHDIECSYNHVIELDGMIVGAFSLIPGNDPTYNVIFDGAWIDDVNPYATIHRLAGLRGIHGVASACFEWSWRQFKNLRVDTHEDNLIMRHCIEKAGFRYCGVIHLLNGSQRLAYQKTL